MQSLGHKNTAEESSGFSKGEHGSREKYSTNQESKKDKKQNKKILSDFQIEELNHARLPRAGLQTFPRVPLETCL